MPHTGVYAIRTQRPDGHDEPPHQHEADEHVLVTSGVIRVDESPDPAAVRPFRAGGYVVIPIGTLHSVREEGDVVADIYWTDSVGIVSDGSLQLSVKMHRCPIYVTRVAGR